ncbi:hypothetical protein [Chrysiogenes arsenatis]|uniref:hypothetical protein n=1 Tax=Chrysiogenes arsenatis TaxID=309797 RepID=UPI00041FB16E|nr:hypothetical protein [Chrysiogenes arsenatis]
MRAIMITLFLFAGFSSVLAFTMTDTQESLRYIDGRSIQINTLELTNSDVAAIVTTQGVVLRDASGASPGVTPTGDVIRANIDYGWNQEQKCFAPERVQFLSPPNPEGEMWTSDSRFEIDLRGLFTISTRTKDSLHFLDAEPEEIPKEIIPNIHNKPLYTYPKGALYINIGHDNYTTLFSQVLARYEKEYAEKIISTSFTPNPGYLADTRYVMWEMSGKENLVDTELDRIYADSYRRTAVIFPKIMTTNASLRCTYFILDMKHSNSYDYANTVDGENENRVNTLLYTFAPKVEPLCQ